MGAYENPPLIIQPNYGEIFARNAQNVMAIARQREEEKKQKEKEKEVKFLQAAERKTEYARRASNIRAGALTENVNQIGLELTDKYFINEDLFVKGEITAEEYAANKSKYESIVNGLASTGSTIREFAETIKGLDISAYQSNPEVFGLIEAYREGKVDAEIIDGKLELKYKDLDGNIHEVDEKWLSNANSWNVIEKFDSEALTTGLAEIEERKIIEKASTTIQTDGAKVTTNEDRYSKAYAELTEEDRINQLLNNKIIAGLNQEELGSYYMDKLVPNMSEDINKDLNYILSTDKYKNLSEEEKEQIRKDVESKEWSNRKFNVDGTPINSSDILGLLSKRQIAKETLDKIAKPKVTSTATVLDQAKPVEEKPDKTNDYIIKTPITDEQWRGVTETGGDKSIANMTNLVSPYGFSVVGSPIASESGESEIGYNVKDNVTNKTIKIFKSDTPQQIRKKMADLRGLDIYSSFITPPIK